MRRQHRGTEKPCDLQLIFFLLARLLAWETVTPQLTECTQCKEWVTSRRG